MRSLPVFSLGLDSSGPFQATWSFFTCGFVFLWPVGTFRKGFYWMSSAQTAVESGGLLRDLVAASVCVCAEGVGGGLAEWPRPKSGLWTVTVQFVFGSPLVAELRSEPKVKTHGEGQQDQRTTTHTAEKGGKKGNGNLWEELDWINRVLRSPAPYYPMIYTAWELGNASRWRRPSVFHRRSGIPRLTPIKSPGIIASDKFGIPSSLMCLF